MFAALVHAPDGSGTAARARWSSATPGRATRAERELAPLLSVGLAADDRGRPDALPGHEHAARRRLPEGLAQLLEVDLHAGSSDGLIDDDRRALRVVPVADGRRSSSSTSTGPSRASSRPTTAVPHRERGLQPAASRRSGPIRPTTDANIAWTRETLRRGRARSCRRPLAELPRRRPGRRRDPRGVRPQLRPARARSSAATTPTTSSTSTTTSPPNGRAGGRPRAARDLRCGRCRP